MRQVLAVATGAFIATLGGLVLGEYELSFDRFPRPGAWMPVVAGVLFGVAMVEAMVWAAGEEPPWLVALSAVLAAGGLIWAGWIFVRHRGEFVPAGFWVAAAVAAAASGLRLRSAGRRESRSRLEP